jgi:AraC-like DNA-binding protein
MDVRIRMLLRIIEEHKGTLQMSPEQVGSLFGLGEARMLRLFSREMGKTLRRHLLEVRMARAAQLVRNVAPLIKTVAFECGYNVVGNFCRDFKLVHGVSPMQMRLRHMDHQAGADLSAFPKALSGQSDAKQ